MDCIDARRRLRSYIDGESSAVSGEALRGHLTDCRACGRLETEIRGLARSVAELPRSEAPREVVDGLREVLRGSRARGAAYRSFSWPSWRLSSLVPSPGWLTAGACAAVVCALAVGAPRAVQMVETALGLNRNGRWEDALRLAQAGLKDASTGEPRCESLYNAAYASARLGDDAASLRYLDRFDRECGDLPEDHWLYREELKLRKEFVHGTPAWSVERAIQLDRDGEWALASAVAEDVLKGPDADEAQRCEALSVVAYSRARLGDHPGAQRAADDFDGRCRALSSGHWARREVESARLRLGSPAAGLLEDSMKKMRAKDWKGALRLAEKAAARPRATTPERCEALDLVAQTQSLLGRGKEADAALRDFDFKCATLPESNWLRAWRARIRREFGR